MIPSRLLLPLLLLAATPLSEAMASDLRLTTVVDGRELELSMSEDHKQLCAGPERTPLPKDPVWVLHGDLREHAAMLRWSPIHTVSRADERSQQVTPDQPWRAEVQVRHAPLEDLKVSRELIPLRMDWPDGLPDGGAAVAVWIVDGRAVETIILPLPSTDTTPHYGFAAQFKLTHDQAGRGQPALLLWRDGSFVAPKPVFEHPGSTAALEAIRFDDAAGMAKALAAGVKLETESRDGLSLMHYAAESGSSACLAVLTAQQPRLVNQPDAHGGTALTHAAQKGRTAAARGLLTARAQANSKLRNQRSPLAHAVRAGHTEIVAILLENRAAVDPEGWIPTPLNDAIERGYADIAALLVAAKARHDFKAPDAGRKLLLAAVRGHGAMVKWLVSRGVDANADAQGATALRLASRDGDAASARALLDAGASPNKAAKDGFTPLMGAAMYGNVEYARTLLEAGADPRAVNAAGGTALHYAAAANADSLVELLLERGAEIDARSRDDYTPLEQALLYGAGRTASFLARHGATIDLASPAAERLLAAAVRHDVAEPVESALREGWPAGSTFAGVWPAVRVAEIFKSHRCLEALVNAGASPADSNVPQPLVTAKDLDEPISLVRRSTLSDPREADEEFAESVVRVSVLIDSEGRPLFPRVDESPDPRLAQAALFAVTNWRFNSLRSKGIPAAARATVPVRFAASSDRAFELDRVSQPPQPLKQSAPNYPYSLKEKGITGRVELGFIVGIDGLPHGIEVLRTTHPDFARAAVDALRTWVFKPGMIDGRPVNTLMKQPMSFTLSN